MKSLEHLPYLVPQFLTPGLETYPDLCSDVKWRNLVIITPSWRFPVATSRCSTSLVDILEIIASDQLKRGEGRKNNPSMSSLIRLKGNLIAVIA